jgi:hypothetical protein
MGVKQPPAATMTSQQVPAGSDYAARLAMARIQYPCRVPCLTIFFN